MSAVYAVIIVQVMLSLPLKPNIHMYNIQEAMYKAAEASKREKVSHI